MRFPIRFTAALAIPMLLIACTEEEQGKSGMHRIDPLVSGTTTEAIAEQGSSEQHNGVGYTFQLISAEAFINRKGEAIDEEDSKALSEESVLVIDFKASGNKEVFSDTRMTMDPDAALQYLVGDLVTDVSVEQNGNTFLPEGSHYEKGISGMGQLRSFVYFRGIDPAKPAKVVYYDRLFGAGFMRITVNKVQ